MNHYQKFHTQRDWENINVTSINRETSHAHWGAYEDAAQAISCDRTASKWTQTLDGTWKFAYCPNTASVEAFWEKTYNHKEWKDIKVPGNWEIQGFGEPIYTNTLYPWDHFSKEKQVIHPTNEEGMRGLPNPPFIPEENPVGCYFSTFGVTADWLEREIFIYFKGVETAYYLWINGKEIGFSKDSKLPSEFNITKYLVEGENTIALQVMRFADSTYLEDQDYWYLSGIFRSVLLLAKPKERIMDWKIDATPNLYYPFGMIKADVSINRFNGFANYKIKLDIFDSEGCLLTSGISDINKQGEYRLYEKPTSNTARIELKIDDIIPWTPEKPKLYRAVMTLLAPSGDEVDFESCRIGFKKVEIIDGVILLNGKRLVVRGVNRHEFEAHGGRTVSVEHMIEEIKLMKRLNMNSVRTCHYPDDPAWYDLCDEWGILLICECNLETHGVLGALSHNPAWGTNFLERAIRMVLTYKNHPSIYSWSLGNESGVGANHASMAGWVREYDPTRLCQYEAGEPGKNISDVRGNMYATPEKILDMLTDATDIRPIVLVEYLYQIRNSGGGMYKFYNLVENYKRFQGGYIWDWQDKCLVAKTSEGKEFFAYGGDFGESIVDWVDPGFMTNNGMVLPDLTPKPCAIEAKQVYCPIIFDKLSLQYRPDLLPQDGNFVIKNRNLVSNTQGYEFYYSIRENGIVVETNIFEIPNIEAGDKAEYIFKDKYYKKQNKEYHIEFSIRYAQENAFAPKGFELGFYQFRLESGSYDYATLEMQLPESPTSVLIVNDSEQVLNIKGANFDICFDKETGLINSLRKNDVEYLSGGASGCFTRPQTGLDARLGWGRFSQYEVHAEENTNRALKKFSVECFAEDKVIVEVVREATFKEKSYAILEYSTYTVYGNGDVKVGVNFRIDPQMKELQRVGVELIIPRGFEELEYFGLGPNENYRDRRNSAKLGVFQNTVEGEHFAFIPPSENGGHEETRWIALNNGQGKVIKISSLIPFHFDVHHNTILDYKYADHEHELVRRKESYLHLDAAHSGIGSDMGWSTNLPQSEQVEAKNYLIEFFIALS